MTEQRDELIELVIKEIIKDAHTRCFALNVEGLLRHVPDNDLEDFLSYEVMQAFWKKYPVS